MIPILVVSQFVFGLFAGIIGVFVVLAIIQHFTDKFEERHKITRMSPPPTKFNYERSAEWLNTLFARAYKESTKSDMLFPVVSHICHKVAENEQMIRRLSLVDFSLGINPPKIKSIKIMPDINGDFVVLFFDFSPELNVNIDLVLCLVKSINITVMAGCAVFFQGVKGGVNLMIPESKGDCKFSISKDIEINVEVGARIGDVRFNTDEYKGVWEKIKKLVISVIKGIEVKFALSMPENNDHPKQEKPPKSSSNPILITNVSLIKPIHYLFL